MGIEWPSLPFNIYEVRNCKKKMVSYGDILLQIAFKNCKIKKPFFGVMGEGNVCCICIKTKTLWKATMREGGFSCWKIYNYLKKKNNIYGDFWREQKLRGKTSRKISTSSFFIQKVFLVTWVTKNNVQKGIQCAIPTKFIYFLSKKNSIF